MTTLDIPTVKAFLLVADLQSFTRAAEAIGETQAAVSLKMQKLEAALGKRLLERSPRSVRLTADGDAFLPRARAFLQAHEFALGGDTAPQPVLSIGISDHAAGAELVPLMARIRSITPSLVLSVSVGFSRALLETFDAGALDAVIVRQEGSRRGGEKLADDTFGWFAAPGYRWPPGEPLRLANLAAPCGVRAVAIRALDKARIGWTEAFTGGGLNAVIAAAQAGLAVAPIARRIAPTGLIDIGAQASLPKLPPSNVMLYSRVSDAGRGAALRALAATFRKSAGGS